MPGKQMNWLANMLKNLVKGVTALSPNCKQAIRLQSEALDRKLPILQCIGLRIHLMLCKWCRRYGKQIRFLRHTTHQHSDQFEELTNQKLPNAARERIKQRLRAEN